MFTSPLPDDSDYQIVFTDYAKRHFIKRFEKRYPGERWAVTMDSIFQSLKRIYSIQMTQQVDELGHGVDCKLFKFDFAVAQSGVSTKASGNRCVVFLDSEKHCQDVLVLYAKSDLPKKIGETKFIRQTLKEQFPDFWGRLSKRV